MEFNKNFSEAPWSNSDISMATGNKVIINASSRLICEMLPVSYPDINAPEELKDLLIKEEAANEQLIRMSPNLFNELEDVLNELKLIKEGKLVIFNWNLDDRIKSINNILTRATDI